jgi:hypothetical protein
MLKLMVCLIASSTRAANHDGYYCRACGVVMEETNHWLLRQASEASSKMGITDEGQTAFPVKEFVEKLCTDHSFKGFTADIRQGCGHIAAEAAFLVAEKFGGEPPTPALLYGRTAR